MIVYVVHHLDACVFSAFHKVILRKSWLLGSRYKTVNMFFDEQRCGNKQQLQILHVHKKQGQHPPSYTGVFRQRVVNTCLPTPFGCFQKIIGYSQNNPF